MRIKQCLRYLSLTVISTVFFWVSNSVLAGGPEIPAPWVIYIGGFGGIDVGSFDYSGDYIGIGPFIVPVANNFHQNGYVGGGDIGFRYHFTPLWFVGLEFAAMGNSETARATAPVISPMINDLFFVLSNQFRVNYNLDATADLGVNITPQTRIYLKGGETHARIAQIFSTFNPDTPALTIGFQEISHKNRWGYLIGLGFAYDFCRWLDLFTEYNYYNYGRIVLDSFFDPNAPAGTDTYSQQVRVRAYSIRLGLNFNFAM